MSSVFQTVSERSNHTQPNVSSLSCACACLCVFVCVLVGVLAFGCVLVSVLVCYLSTRAPCANMLPRADRAHAPYTRSHVQHHKYEHERAHAHSYLLFRYFDIAPTISPRFALCLRRRLCARRSAGLSLSLLREINERDVLVAPGAWRGRPQAQKEGRHVGQETIGVQRM